MLRAQYERRDPVPQDVIEAVEFQTPRLDAGQALVEVVAAPINPADVLTLTGEYGVTTRKRVPSTLDELTPQELRLAKLVAAGASNRDVASQPLLSPKTVEYHLRKVFMKVGVSSPVELANLALQSALVAATD